MAFTVHPVFTWQRRSLAFALMSAQKFRFLVLECNPERRRGFPLNFLCGLYVYLCWLKIELAIRISVASLLNIKFEKQRRELEPQLWTSLLSIMPDSCA